MDKPDEEHTLDIAQGDVGLSRHLKNSLRLLQDKAEDPAFKRLVDDVLSGRRSMRDMVNVPEFTKALDPLVAQGAETYRNLSDDEKEELRRQGEDQLEQLRREPDTRRVSDTEDDEDFSDRSYLQ